MYFACQARIRPVRVRALSAVISSMLALITLTLSTQAKALPCDFQNGDVFTDICAYIESGPVQIGGLLKVHVSSSRPQFNIAIRRAGNTDNPVLQSTSFNNGTHYTTSTTKYNGLNWGNAHIVNIPTTWKSAIYEISLNNGLESYPEFVAIRSATPGSTSKILVLDSLPTKIAYSSIGGKSLYGFNSTNGSAATEVSMERPTGRGQWSEHRDFVAWLDRKGIAYEAASMMDLHRDPNLLKNYNLVILVGHNEYWSKEMRDNWDNYLAAGGNAAIFSGNTMWWQVRFSDDYKHLICYKDENHDPLYGRDNAHVTTLWSHPLINRPENLSIGVSFRNGGYHNYTEAGVQYYVKNAREDNGTNGGFKVTDASHWVFSGTGLTNNVVFGRGDDISSRPIAGYEVDGALFKMTSGKPIVTGEDKTPTNFQILAITPAYAVNSPYDIEGVIPNNYNAQGWGTMGIFKPSATSGTVFVAPTIDWAEGLNDPQVARITENVLNQLKNRAQAVANTNTVTTSPSVTINPSTTSPIINSANTATTVTTTSTQTNNTSAPAIQNNASINAVAPNITTSSLTNTPAATAVQESSSGSGGGGSTTLLTLSIGLIMFIYRNFKSTYK